MKINSTYALGAKLTPADQATVKAEPMLFRASFDFAMLNGGPLTREFLKKLGREDVVIDSRVHMLMPKMYPCIPGWHHDDVPRERSDGQPNYDNPSYKAKHCLALWGDCSLTQFAVGEHDIEIPEVGKVIYRELSPQVEKLCETGVLKREIAPECQLVFFDWNSWHAGSETTKHGFRFFIRASWECPLVFKNEIRHNANVYMKELDAGW